MIQKMKFVTMMPGEFEELKYTQVKVSKVEKHCHRLALYS